MNTPTDIATELADVQRRLQAANERLGQAQERMPSPTPGRMEIPQDVREGVAEVQQLLRREAELRLELLS